MANTNPNNRTNPITNILNYPLDVVQDGHHILLTVFETEGVNYQSPYTDVNIASNQINSAKRQSAGLNFICQCFGLPTGGGSEEGLATGSFMARCSTARRNFENVPGK